MKDKAPISDISPEHSQIIEMAWYMRMRIIASVIVILALSLNVLT